MKKFFFSAALMALASCMTFTSCSDDDNSGNDGGASGIAQKRLALS